MNRDAIQVTCTLCGGLIAKPRPGQLAHGWCAIHYGRGSAIDGELVARSAAGAPESAEPPRADVAVEAAAARWPDASAGLERPIGYMGESPMPRTQKKVEPIEPAGPTLDQVVAIGHEYEALKAEAERIATAIERKAEYLRQALPKFGGRIRIGERALGLVPFVKETFDLDAAKLKRGMKGLLKPYIEIVEKFDLKTARKHIDDETLNPFVSREESTRVQFLKLQPGEGEGGGE